MNSSGILVLKYQDNFADNLTSIAYGKILGNNTSRKFYFENLTSSRAKFEDKMSCFNFDCDYVSSARVEDITKKAFNLNGLYINETKIEKEIRKKKSSKNNVLDLKHFNIDDIKYISSEIKTMFNFKDTSFILNYDILEDIKNSNSIGLYINKNDTDMLDVNYIKRAYSRLNKYVKKPKLFIFSDRKIENKLPDNLNYVICSLHDWREEFLFLKHCKHKIIFDADNSYSIGLWASVLADRSYAINIYDKEKTKTKYKSVNWLGV